MLSAIVSMVELVLFLLVGWIAIAVGAAFVVAFIFAVMRMLVSVAKMYWRAIKWVCDDGCEPY